MTARNARRLPDPLGASAGRFAARPAVTARGGLRTRFLTDRQLHAAADVVAASLILHHGLRRGEGVILLPPSGVRAVCVLFGLIRADVVAVPLDLNATPAFVGAVAQKTDSAAAFVARGLPAPAGLTRIAIEDPPSLRGAEPPAADVMRDEVAEIAFISRTTGDPKGVVLTHGNNTSDLESATSVVPRGKEMRLPSILSLSHMFEQTVGLFLPNPQGGAVLYAPSLKPSAIVAGMLGDRLRIVGRFSEWIVLPGGMKVCPAEAGIRECVVPGLPDAQGGERLHAVIRPETTGDDAESGRTVERVNASLACHQRITGDTPWAEEFPMTALQKVQRKAMTAALVGLPDAPGGPPPAADPAGLAGRLMRSVLRTASRENVAKTRLDVDLGLDLLGRRCPSATGAPKRTVTAEATILLRRLVEEMLFGGDDTMTGRLGR